MAPYLDDGSSPAPMRSAQPAPGPVVGGDDLDDLFDYDAGLDDFFRDLDSVKKTNLQEAPRRPGLTSGLGIDEEIEVVKKPRAPRVKLDENRLLSQAGIPKLRKRARDLKFKGKGHEYSDAARLLSFYQLWLDDLFPKAKFLDALAMVEKLGHKKRIQIMRMDWINEGKPKDPVEEDSIFEDPVLPPRERSDHAQTAIQIAPIFGIRQAERPKTPEINGDMEEDLYDATPRISHQETSRAIAPIGESSLFGPRKEAISDDSEDDLNALLAEQEMEEAIAQKRLHGTHQDHNMNPPETDFDDEMEAMAEMGGGW